MSSGIWMQSSKGTSSKVTKAGLSIAMNSITCRSALIRQYSQGWWAKAMLAWGRWLQLPCRPSAPLRYCLSCTASQHKSLAVSGGHQDDQNHISPDQTLPADVSEAQRRQSAGHVARLAQVCHTYKSLPDPHTPCLSPSPRTDGFQCAITLPPCVIIPSAPNLRLLSMECALSSCPRGGPRMYLCTPWCCIRCLQQIESTQP